MGHHEEMEQPPDVRYLWILRHAKAAPEPTWGGLDRDRPLTERGRRDATALGRRLVTEVPPLGVDGLIAPELAMCSSALRTSETAELVLGAGEDRIPLDVYGSLYQAGPDTVLTYLREVDEHARSALVVGHNPTMYLLAWDLLEEGSDDRDALESGGFPTCGLAVLALRVGAWEDVAAGCATLVGLFAPPY
ncbi:MAG: histidine phosphatase family protein [Acidimicrobiales bacterium]|jgi:phosphohistidine phosphatase